MERFNELMISLVSIFMFLFSDILPDDRMKYDVGFYMVYSVVFMMAVNLVVVFFYV